MFFSDDMICYFLQDNFGFNFLAQAVDNNVAEYVIPDAILKISYSIFRRTFMGGLWLFCRSIWCPILLCA